MRKSWWTFHYLRGDLKVLHPIKRPQNVNFEMNEMLNFKKHQIHIA